MQPFREFVRAERRLDSDLATSPPNFSETDPIIDHDRSLAPALWNRTHIGTFAPSAAEECESQDDVRVDPESHAASQFTTIVVELVPHRSQATVATLGVLAFLIKATSWTVFVPKQRFVVRVLRRADGKELVRYDYVHMSDARFHASSLMGRMSSWDVSDLCAQLGPLRSTLWRTDRPRTDRGN
ncbi:hypothetical protein Back2_20100 [Nocardioides baekrokdamisoli]|uniref:Uncharacterized protein n=1 Tax=Nocardioides baekrokdamisoli TaxID=1804624 RepID=A0A3G9IZA8_9ACTN|nr:hypothetical protein Back2_20100 [Nocardioides baekrokdamisoli]